MLYVKLKECSRIKFTKFLGWKFQAWDQGEKKFIKADQYFEGSQQVYEFETQQGQLTLSRAQLKDVLLALVPPHSLEQHEVEVKHNGKQGTDSRFFFRKANLTK